MARWKLIEPHYLRVPDTKWEYQEVDRITGRPKRTQFPVPQYLNPNFEDDLKSFGQGTGDVSTWDIIVSDGHNSQPKDIIFHEKDDSPGKPTPGMLPLDDEAKAISAKFEKIWAPPSEEQPSFTAALEEKFLRQMSEIQAGLNQAPQDKGFTDFMQSMSAMMQQQTEILAQLVKVQTQGERRKVA